METLFFDIGILVIIAAIFGYLASILKQPLLLAYIVGGILLGPTGLWLWRNMASLGGANLPSLSLVGNAEVINTISVIGIVLLLFLVGLELDLKKAKEFGTTIIAASLIQVLATFLLAAILGFVLGFPFVINLYLAIGLVFSSTIVSVKYLSESRDIASLHGRIVIGILLAQDLLAIFALILIASLGTTGTLSILSLAHVVIKLGWLLVLTVILGHYIFPLVFKVIARSQELLFLSGVALAFLFALMAENLHISMEIGAFLAGISLASLPYHAQLANRVKPLRDFFVVIFFVILGMHLDLALLAPVWWQTIIVVLFVIILKPLIVLIGMGLLGFKKRTAFLVGISLAHISEFSLIVLQLGKGVGHVDEVLISMISVTMIISIVASSYLFTYRHPVYNCLKRILKIFERKEMLHPLEVAGNISEKLEDHIVLCGYGSMGHDVLINIASTTKNYMVIDLDPAVIKELVDKRVRCLYGDIADEEILNDINVRKAKAVVSTVRDPFSNMALVLHIREENKKTAVIVVAESIVDALDLYEAGADYVVLPQIVGGAHTAMVFEDIHNNNLDKIFRLKKKQIGQLKIQQLLGHQ